MCTPTRPRSLFHALPLLSSLASRSRHRFPSLVSAPTCLVYPFNTSLSNRLLHFAVCCSCNIVRHDRLSHARPRHVSHSVAPTLDGGSIDLRGSIVETRLLENRPDRSDYLKAGGRFFGFRQLWRNERTAARSLNQRSYYAIVEELIKEIAWSYASHE